MNARVQKPALTLKYVDFIRPILRGRDIKRYHYEFANIWLINLHNGIKEKNIAPVNIEDYPAIQSHLDSYGEKLALRTDKGHTKYHLRNCAYMDDFSKQKIVWGNLCLSAQYAMVDNDYFISAPSPMITGANKYILAVLNSTVSDWYIRQLGVTRNGGYFEYKPMFVEKIPIPNIIEDKQKEFIKLVEQIIDKKSKGIETTSLEKEINNKIYGIYGFTTDEIMYLNAQNAIRDCE